MIRILVLTLILLLTSCSTVAPPSTPSAKVPWKSREPKLSQINHWQVSGKIAVQTAKDSGSASVDWRQNQKRFNISLMGPLGAGGLKLFGQPGQVTLQTAQGKTFTASSPEQLLAQQWGFNVPVSNMNYWIRGMPVPGEESNTKFDAYGRVSSMQQQGWNVQYLSYTNASGMELPSRIAITSPALKVKIVIYQWQLS